MKKILFVLIVTGIFFSCKQSSTKMAVVKAPIDSLITNYNTAWNNHDSVALRNLFAPDALLIDDAIVAMNAEEISAKWIKPFVRIVSNATSTKLQEWSTHYKAGFTGTWTLDVKTPKDVMKAKGTYTMIWTKNEKGEWKISTADLHSAPAPM